MSVLVAYASRHGSTQGIAERIAARLCADGIDAEARPAAGVDERLATTPSSSAGPPTCSTGSGTPPGS